MQKNVTQSAPNVASAAPTSATETELHHVLKTDAEPNIVILSADGSPSTNPESGAFANDWNALPVAVRRATRDALLIIRDLRKELQDAGQGADKRDRTVNSGAIFVATFMAAGLPDYAAAIKATLTCLEKGEAS